MTLIFSMDQVLYKASQVTVNNESSSIMHFYKEFIMHMSAQLCFHIATLMFKQAKKVSHIVKSLNSQLLYKFNVTSY